jgi:ABC-type dipeptide/oligopeptide/nickel transport system permease component
MLITAVYLLVTVLADLLQVRLDPRLARAR